MKLVIDTNRIIAALICDGASRKILFDNRFKLVSPERALLEVRKYEKEIRLKAGISADELNLLIDLICEKISIVPKEEYEKFLDKAGEMIDDADDEPFIALALATSNSGIWSDDKHFFKQIEIPVWKTSDLMEKIYEGEIL
ncbi:PIN domain-containing protein [Candidatus Micrarchaeota archaeon]|nr:PIN domain-containing protein [Candidatus Micrarchaeota archaeon]